MTKGMLVLHGPNLNPGKREPEVYGHLTLDDINTRLRQWATEHDVDPYISQSNHEGALIDAIQRRPLGGRIVINPGHTHTTRTPCGCYRGRIRPGDRGAPVQHSRPRGVPAHIGDRAGMPRPDRGARLVWLYPGA